MRYRQRKDRTEIRIRTDWDTTEDVVIRHASKDPSLWFLIEGKPFPATERPGRALHLSRPTGHPNAGDRSAGVSAMRSPRFEHPPWNV